MLLLDAQVCEPRGWKTQIFAAFFRGPKNQFYLPKTNKSQWKITIFYPFLIGDTFSFMVGFPGCTSGSVGRWLGRGVPGMFEI